LNHVDLQKAMAAEVDTRKRRDSPERKIVDYVSLAKVGNDRASLNRKGKIVVKDTAAVAGRRNFSDIRAPPHRGAYRMMVKTDPHQKNTRDMIDYLSKRVLGLNRRK
jgi:hypothetical protein